MSNKGIDTKKQQERFFLEQFIIAASLQAEIVEMRESPDFIIQVKGRRVGVEITELFISHDSKADSMQAQESISKRIVEKAQKLYEKIGAPPAHVTVCFGPGRDLRLLNRDQTAQALVSFVSRLNLAERQLFEWRPEELDGALPDEISFIHALGLPNYEIAHWGVAGAGWVASLSLSLIQPRIDEKVQNLLLYRKAVAENWLLIVANSTKPSQFIEVKNDFDPSMVSSLFERTFFYRYPGKVAIELGRITK